MKEFQVFIDMVRSFTSQSGFSFSEFVITLALVATASIGAVSLSVKTVAEESKNSKAMAANIVLRRVIELIDKTAPEKVRRRFNVDPLDDPNGPGTAPGANLIFEVTRKGDDESLFLERIPRRAIFGESIRAVRFDVAIVMSAHEDDPVLKGYPTSQARGPFATTPMKIQVFWQDANGRRVLEVARVIRSS